MFGNYLGPGKVYDLPIWADIRYPTIGFPKNNPINQCKVNPMVVEVTTVSIQN